MLQKSHHKPRKFRLIYWILLKELVHDSLAQVNCCNWNALPCRDNGLGVFLTHCDHHDDDDFVR